MSRFLEAFRATVRAEMQISHSVGSENPENPKTLRSQRRWLH